MKHSEREAEQRAFEKSREGYAVRSTAAIQTWQKTKAYQRKHITKLLADQIPHTASPEHVAALRAAITLLRVFT